MCRRVALAMPILPVLPGHRLFQRQRHVPPHVRIGPFLNRHRRGGMRHKEMQQPVPPTSPGGGLLQ